MQMLPPKLMGFQLWTYLFLINSIRLSSSYFLKTIWIKKSFDSGENIKVI